MRSISFFILFHLICSVVFSQEKLKGVLFDTESKDPMPFALVGIKNTTNVIYTDINGVFSIGYNSDLDTIQLSQLGYETKNIQIKEALLSTDNDTVYFHLSPKNTLLDEIVVTPPENPAWRVMRKVILNRKKNSNQDLSFLQYESYNRTELYFDNLSEKFKNRKIFKQLESSLNGNTDGLKNDQGKLEIPAYISESISENYLKYKPTYTSKEVIKATKLTGVGVTDGSVVSKFSGSSFLQPDFYKNRIKAFDKQFVSPIASDWKQNYRYYLDDSLFIDGHWCYEITIKPKRAQDIAFNGKIWITDSSFALKKVDLTVNQGVNLNFISQINLKSNWKLVNNKRWVFDEIDIFVDMEELNDNLASFIIKLHAKHRDHVFDNKQESRFYDYNITVDENANSQTHDWDRLRRDTLDLEKQKVFGIIDTLKGLPVVKSYLSILNTLVNGHFSVGKFDFGPYPFTYANNQFEGHRLRLGGKTNYKFSKKIELSGYVAYGTKDKTFKHQLKLRYILNRRPWTEIRFKRHEDLEQLGLTTGVGDNLFESFARWGTIRGPYTSTMYLGEYFRQLNKSFSIHTSFKQSKFSAHFPFEYFSQENRTKSIINASELMLSLSFSKDEIFVVNDNSRISLGSKRLPSIKLSYTRGLKNIIGGDFSYNKFQLDLKQRVSAGFLGYFRYFVNMGYVYPEVPFPLAFVHQGNQGPFYNPNSFNTMNFFEFSSSQYFSFAYVHHFDGLIMNRIPLIKKLKWRAVVNSKVLIGDLKEGFQKLVPSDLQNFSQANNPPFIEIGYGVENIFRFFRLQAFNRLTYRNLPDSQSFRIKGTVQFTF